MRSLAFYLSVFVCVTLLATPAAQESLADGARRKTFDQLLDLYVRNGDVYYRALRAERAKLDGFVNLQATTAVDKLSREEQIAFWRDRLQRVVLKTVAIISLAAKSSNYRPNIRQISGAFERVPHRVAGRTVTSIRFERPSAGFRDPRVHFALGPGPPAADGCGAKPLRRTASRNARGGGRRVRDARPVRPGRSGNRQDPRQFDLVVAGEGSRGICRQGPASFASRSPIERAVIAYVLPNLLPSEKEFVEKNSFQLVYTPFDWNLNDLTGRGGR